MRKNIGRKTTCDRQKGQPGPRFKQLHVRTKSTQGQVAAKAGGRRV